MVSDNYLKNLTGELTLSARVLDRERDIALNRLKALEMTLPKQALDNMVIEFRSWQTSIIRF